MEYPSQLIEQAVNEMSNLPGIGKKTALRLVLYLLKQPKAFTYNFSSSLTELIEQTKYCSTCYVIGDTEECTCKTAYRDNSIICVVEDTPDVLAIRHTGQYNGLFHVLGGKISPMDGIGPEDIKIDALIQRIKGDTKVKEVLLALSTTIEGDTTAFYITKLLKNQNLKITTISRGISVGSELEYTDELTLGRSIIDRTTFENN